MGQEHREFTRVPAHLWGIRQDDQGADQYFEVGHVSLRGGHAVCDEPLPIGTEFAMRLCNDLAEGALEIVVQAIVRNHDATGMGLEFTSMPLESYEHLSRLVELYAQDPDRVVHEIHDHVGLKLPAGKPPAAA